MVVALLLTALAIGGCDRGASPATTPPASTTTAPAEADSAAAPTATEADRGTRPADGVDALLEEADQQLSQDAQPAADED